MKPDFNNLLKGNHLEFLSMIAQKRRLSDDQFKIILNKFFSEGEWYEFGYNKEDDDFGYFGVIPACFWLISLCKLAKRRSQLEVTTSHKTANVLLQKIQNGCIQKTIFNRNDVLNTSLLAAFALMLYANTFQNKGTYKAKLIEINARRIVYRVMLSQHRSGAFPYQSNSNHISLLYHYMVVALLEKFNNIWNNYLLDRSVLKSREFLKSTLKDNDINWLLDTSGDKIGAVWAYFWLSAVGFKLRIYHDGMQLLEKGGLLSDLSGEDDPRYTAWGMLANNVEEIELANVSDLLKKKHNIFSVLFRVFLFKLDVLMFNISILLRKFGIKLRNYIFLTGHELN